jgi:eukaryotic-like serine/threonine-protein kinase
LPVVGVTHAAALAYCEWLSRSTGLPYRLPTADEWEKAARGVDGREYVWGDRYDPTFALTRDTPAARGRPKLWAPPGSFPTDCSVYGIWDLGGNAREWTDSPLSGGEPGYQIKGTSVVARALRVYDADDSLMVTYDVGFRYAMSLPADACD